VSEVHDLDALARAVDERVLALPEGCDPARVFGVRLRPRGVMLVPLWSGVAREIPSWLVPPPDVVAVALTTRGWAAPMEDDGSVACRPSEHPQRRRIHQTVVVGGDGDDVSVLRYEDDPAAEPLLLHEAMGVVHARLVACWLRRPEVA
jgi:hypothetical protein